MKSVPSQAGPSHQVARADIQEQGETWCAVCHAPYTSYGCSETTCHGLDND